MRKIQGTMSLIVSKKVENVTDSLAKYDEVNIAKVQLVVTLMDGSVDTILVDDHFLDWEK